MLRRLPALLVGLLFGCKVTLAGSDFDPKCPQGYYPGILVTEGQFTVPFERMYNLTGSFQHAEWYTFVNTTNYGEDNTIGATRQGGMQGFQFDERLVRVFKDDSEAMIAYVNQIPTRFPNPSGGKVATYYSYIEEFRLISICEGTATLVHLWVAYCADDVANSWDAWGRIRGDALSGVVVAEGAQEFKGTCPQRLIA